MKKCKILNRFILIIGILLATALQSCYSTMDEISRDPNSATEVHPMLIFTDLCVTTFSIDFYGIEPNRTAWQWDGRNGGGTLNFLRRGWASEYRRIGFAHELVNEAERIDDERYVHLAAFFRAYWFFNVTRLFGDCPYSEGGKGREENILSPKYDLQEDIVYGLLQELEAANTALAPYSNTQIEGDIIYGGDIMSWRRLINMYRLRILVNCSMKTTIKDRSVSEMFAAIINDPVNNPLMESFEDSAIFDESLRSDTYYFYNDNNFVSSHRLTKNVVDMMRDKGDMRLPKIGEVMNKLGDNPTAAQINDLDNYRGVIPNPGPTDDTNNAESQVTGEQSKINKRWYLEPVGPSFMQAGYAEQEFIIAEAILRGWIAGDINAHYKNGITAAYKFLGVGDNHLNTYLANPKVTLNDTDTNTQKLKKIITEKYLNFFLNAGFEAYFELRRTGYPDFMEYLDHQSTHYIYNDGYLPLRYQYSANEVSYNNENMKAAVKRMDQGDNRNSKMWLLQGTDQMFNPDPFPFRR